MESITLKVDTGLAKAMKKAMKPKYATKTEFIREAIRDKITKAEKEEALKNLEKYFGTGAHHKTTYEEERVIREKVGREYAKRHGIDLN